MYVRLQILSLMLSQLWTTESLYMVPSVSLVLSLMYQLWTMLDCRTENVPKMNEVISDQINAITTFPPAVLRDLTVQIHGYVKSA